jgi:signal transduction histidine kinase
MPGEARARYGRPVKLRRLIENQVIDAIVVVLFLFAEGEAWFSDSIKGPQAVLAIGAATWTLPLLARRRFPFGAPLFVLGALVGEALLANSAITQSGISFAACVLAVGLIGMHGVTRRGVSGGAAALVAIGVIVALDPEGGFADFFVIGGVVAFSWIVGLSLSERTRRTAELEERAERLERERDAEARAAVAEERARIAREMHDVVAHSLSVMVVQAEAAEEMIGLDPERARVPLIAVQDTGRAALGELRRMLGVLREKEESGMALAPQPGLAGLDELVGHVRAAGLPVSVRVEGEPRPLPPGIDLSAYRIVQEGLTNSLKHAGPANAEVLVRYGDGEIELRVSDDGRGHDPASNGDGHGLVGMRERVAVYGGRLSAGPGQGGGYTLSARLPLDGARAA